MSLPMWLTWVQRVQALAQDGLAYSQNPFDIERFRAITEISAEVVSAYSGIEFEKVRDLFAGQEGYATPKLDIRGVVFKEGKILLVKELADGGWTMPGGWVDVGEPPSVAVEREVWEESGYEVRARRLLAVYDRNADHHGHPPYVFHLYKIFMLCDLVGGEPAESIETGGAAFYGLGEIPPLSITRTSRQEVERMFYLYQNPDLLTEFD